MFERFYLRFFGLGYGPMALRAIWALGRAGNQPPEAFYFPAADIDNALPYVPRVAVSLAWFARPAGPARAESQVGRNDACPCGSGKKFKKCCAGRP